LEGVGSNYSSIFLGELVSSFLRRSISPPLHFYDLAVPCLEDPPPFLGVLGIAREEFGEVSPLSYFDLNYCKLLLNKFIWAFFFTCNNWDTTIG